MPFHSTRSQGHQVSFFEAFANGLAPDGGLYLPATLPKLPPDLLDPRQQISYPDLAFRFFSLFETGHSTERLGDLIQKAHDQFSSPENAAPLRQLDQNLFVLELFHGPTLAFKDFGMQVVGNFFEDQILRTGESITVLGATSGDTGAAAVHGLANKPGVRVIILFPEGKVAKLQELQMTCSGAPNIFPVPIQGSFDDAQFIVKRLFGDLEFRKRNRLSAVNSINLARVLAQSVYFLHAWRCLPTSEHRARLTFTVPTGNFGNIFAGWLLTKMGLPVKRFRIATNQNDILFRFFTTGQYEPGMVSPSLAPSMDIQVASNFERFLFYHCKGDTARVTEMMRTLGTEGRVEVPDFDPDRFTASRTDDAGIRTIIRSVYEKFQYVVDPHTACGFAETACGFVETDPLECNVVLATAHPAKFPEVIESAIGIHPVDEKLEKLKAHQPVSFRVGSDEGAIRRFLESGAAN